MKIWIITDTHFNHKKILEYGRPAGYEEKLWKNLDVLKPGDLVIHLGDVCIGDDEAIHEKLNQKTFGMVRILVRGNHDKKSDSWYFNKGWDFVCSSYTVEYFGKKIHFTHRPHVRIPWVDINIHGHTHGNTHRNMEHDMFYDPSYNIEMAMEHSDYKPVLLEKFISRIK